MATDGNVEAALVILRAAQGGRRPGESIERAIALLDAFSAAQGALTAGGGAAGGVAGGAAPPPPQRPLCELGTACASVDCTLAHAGAGEVALALLPAGIHSWCRSDCKRWHGEPSHIFCMGSDGAWRKTGSIGSRPPLAATALRKARIDAKALCPFVVNMGRWGDTDRKQQYSARSLAAGGYPLAELAAGGFMATDFKASGMPAREVLAGRPLLFSYAEMTEGGYDDAELGVALGVAGLTLAECLAAGFPAKAARAAGFKLADLKAAGYRGCWQMRMAGYPLEFLREGGYSLDDLDAATGVAARLSGYPFADPSFKHSRAKDDITAAGRRSPPLEYFSVEEFAKAGFAAADFRAARFEVHLLFAPPPPLHHSGRYHSDAPPAPRAIFPVAELRAAGYSLKELWRRDAFSLRELHAGGFRIDEILASELAPRSPLTLNDLLGVAKETGKEVTTIGSKDCFSWATLARGGVPLADIVRALPPNYLPARRIPIADLQAAGASLADLRGAGYPAQELKKVFALKDFITAGGFAKRELAALFSLDELMAAGGYTLADFKGTFSAIELLNRGFTVSQLAAAGF